MNHTPLTLDHLAVVAPSIEAGVAHVHDLLGIAVPEGGLHPLMSTKNHLMQLGHACFLEIIAIDPAAPPPARPRWFNLDHRADAPPRLEHWLLGTADLDKTITEAGPLSGDALKLTRGNLSWRISVQADGSLPMDGAFPSFLQWPTGPHPAGNMVDLGCRLVNLTIEHPDANRISEFLNGRLSDSRVHIMTSNSAGIRASIDTPTGVRELF